MESKTTNIYAVTDINARIKEILDSSESFEELNSIPSRERLTYSNGFYVNCTSVFIDIRDSTQLPQKHTRPVLGKIYRSYLSECVAVMNSDPNCRDIVITGDCVHGIMNTPIKPNIDIAFSTAARLNSLVMILNWRLEQKGYTTIRCGIGIDYGRALMMKAGYKGSGLNEVIWMGDVVNQASNLCHQANKGVRKPLQVSAYIYGNLNEHNRNLLSPVYGGLGLSPMQYEGDVINIEMNDWLEKEKGNDTLIKALTTNLVKPPRGLLARKPTHWI